MGAHGWWNRAGRWAGALGMIVGSLGGALLAHATAAQEGPAVQVEAREVAFAATMASRDFDAFLTFISPEAVFFSQSGPLRGIDAIARAWSAYFEGDEPPFSWHPDVVEVLDSGELALTSGPVLSSSGDEVGRFNTVWRRDSDGIWRVVFDKGS